VNQNVGSKPVVKIIGGSSNRTATVSESRYKKTKNITIQKEKQVMLIQGEQQ
jgi:hypothetical protein